MRERQLAYDDGMIAGSVDPVYKFDHGVLHDDDVNVGAQSITIGGNEVRLDADNPFEDMRIA